ncbi:aldose 1-epimerase [Pseudomonas sp. 18175]|uniref:aldose epimerase family protein n=1 Tax=Pseudomonas sp. 18175 TaxID=3390056 RepID=UPI003D210F09
MQTLVLHNPIWSLVLLPQWGGRSASLTVGTLDVLTPIQANRFDPLHWPRGGAYPLLPYSNRLRDARLTHGGVTHTLPAHPAAHPHTLHGVSHTLAWDVIDHSPTHALLSVDYNGEHWPWPVRFQQRFDLEGNCIRLQLSVTNLGDSSMPAGLGLHPYFQRHPGMTVQCAPKLAWELDADYLPIGSALALHEPLRLPADVAHEVAIYASRWDGRAQLDYPQGQLLMQADHTLGHLVIFAPPGAPYLCLEPVSHLANAFNQWPEQGTQVLEAGHTLSATFSLTWTPV